MRNYIADDPKFDKDLILMEPVRRSQRRQMAKKYVDHEPWCDQMPPHRKALAKVEPGKRYLHTCACGRRLKDVIKCIYTVEHPAPEAEIE